MLSQSVQDLAEGEFWCRRFVFNWFAAVDFSQGFELFCVFLFLAFELVARVADEAAAVAEFVEVEDFTAEAAKHSDHGEALLGVEVGAEDDLGEAGGHELEADFGEAGRVTMKEVSEGILVEAGLDEQRLVEAPLVVAAAGGPIGDITGSDFEAAFVEGLGDLVVRDGVADLSVDQAVAEFGEAGDFAVARFGFGDAGLGRVRFGEDCQGRGMGRGGGGCGVGNGAGCLVIHKLLSEFGMARVAVVSEVWREKLFGYYRLLWVTTSDYG